MEKTHTITVDYSNSCDEKSIYYLWTAGFAADFKTRPHFTKVCEFSMMCVTAIRMSHTQ